MVQWFKKLLVKLFKLEVHNPKYQISFDIDSIKKDMKKNYTYLFDYQSSDGFRVLMDQIIKARNVQTVEIARQGAKLKDSFELGKQLGRLEVLNDIITGIDMAFQDEDDRRKREAQVPGEKKIIEKVRRVPPAIRI